MTSDRSAAREDDYHRTGKIYICVDEQVIDSAWCSFGSGEGIFGRIIGEQYCRQNKYLLVRKHANSLRLLATNGVEHIQSL